MRSSPVRPRSQTKCSTLAVEFMAERSAMVRGHNHMTLPRAVPWLIHALPLAVALALTATAHADPAQGSRLVVRVAPELAIPAEEVRAVIAAELGVAIVKESADLGALDIHLNEANKLAIEYRRPNGDVLVRIVALPTHPADRLSVIAFVTGNLVRDQLDGLAFGAGEQTTGVVVAAPAEEPPPATVPVAAQPPAAPPAVPVVTPTTVTATSPTIAASAERTEPESVAPFAIGIVAPLSTQSLLGGTTVRAGIYAVAGTTKNIEGFSISGAADIATGRLHGAQVAGAVVVAQDSVGLQVGGAASIARDMRGIQLGGAATVARDFRGIQIGGAATVAQDTYALQLAGAGALARDMRGIQIAGAVSAARSTRGLQVGGGATLAERVDGLQLAGGAAIAGRIDGAQIASINIAGNVDGLQLGAINVGKHVKGLQVGAINVSDDIDGIPFGAISIVRHGRTDVDAWAETNGLAALALRHGSRRWHNIYAVGVTPDTGDRPMFGMGMGAHSRIAGGMALDLDGIAWRTQGFDDGIGLLTQARATVALSVGSFDVFAAAAYNVSIESEGDKAPVMTAFARRVDQPMSSNVDVTLWPSLSAGIRGHLGGPR
ncbi:MAG: hypothetical protein HOV81_44955 [Kofleriaceae bacterium]|nr:hypothetical protein [Kofleriaceae bacterium]